MGSRLLGEAGKVLAIDTSGSFAFCAVSNGLGQIFEQRSVGVVSHNEELSTLVARALELASVTPKELSALVLGTGPGSFTGLRIGYSFAKGFALAQKLSVLQLSSMQAAAKAAQTGGAPAVVLADARRDEFFMAAYAPQSDGGVAELLAPTIVPKLDISSLALTICGGQEPVWIYEPGVALEFTANAPQALARGLLEIAGTHEIQPFSVEGVAALQPQYLRAVAARTIAERAQNAKG